MKTFFVTTSLFLVIFSTSFSYAEESCLDIKQQQLCYDIEGSSEAVDLDLKPSSSKDSMLVDSDLAQNQVKDFVIVSSDLLKIDNDSIQPSIYDNFTKADELYYRFAYKILDRNNNNNTTVVITRD